MSASQYELLKCDVCGKTLGYIYVTVRIYPPRQLLKSVAGFYQKIERTAFCEECFLKRKTETAKHEY